MLLEPLKRPDERTTGELPGSPVAVAEDHRPAADGRDAGRLASMDGL
jgi:hypothetical protein